VSNEDAALQEALNASLMPASGMNPITSEPLKAEDRKRESGTPCGLKNIGNTCYFNSII